MVVSKSKGKPRNATGAGGNEGQDLYLNPDTLSLITKKIEANLRDSQTEQAPPRTKDTSEIRKQNQVQKKIVTSSKPNRQQDPVSAHKKENKTAVSDSKPQGQKRLRDGQLKDSVFVRSQPNGAQNRQKSRHVHSLERSRLEQEILALGGSKDDLKLIEEEESRSEFEGGASGSEKPATGGLKKELLQLVRELGIEKVSKEVDEGSESDQNKTEPDTHNVDVVSTKSLGKDGSNSQPKQPGKKESQFVRTLVSAVNSALVGFADDSISKLSPCQIGTLSLYHK